MLNRLTNLHSKNRKKISLKVIVTGCPRSGTSFLSGLVSKLGYNLGPDEWLYPADEHNKHGYFECYPLQKISIELLKKFGGDFHHELPVLEPGWTVKAKKEKRKIARVVNEGKIELYKGNRLIVLADLYDELYPNAKWIYIERDIQETYQSRFGKYLTFEEWENITAKRIAAWHRTRPSKKSLHLKYRDFKTNIDETIDKILSHLDIDPNPQTLEICKEFFMPVARKNAANTINQA